MSLFLLSPADSGDSEKMKVNFGITKVRSINIRRRRVKTFFFFEKSFDWTFFFCFDFVPATNEPLCMLSVSIKVQALATSQSGEGERDIKPSRFNTIARTSLGLSRRLEPTKKLMITVSSKHESSCLLTASL